MPTNIADGISNVKHLLGNHEITGRVVEECDDHLFFGRSNTAFGERKGSAFRAADSQTTQLFSSKPSSIERELDKHADGPHPSKQITLKRDGILKKADEYLSSGSGGKTSSRGPGTARNDCRSRSKGCSSEEREADEKRKNAGVAATLVQKS